MDFGTKRFKTEDLAQERQGRASEVDNLQKQLSQSAAEAWLSALQQGVDFTTFRIFLYLYFLGRHPIPASKDGCANGFERSPPGSGTRIATQSPGRGNAGGTACNGGCRCLARSTGLEGEDDSIFEPGKGFIM